MSVEEGFFFFLLFFCWVNSNHRKQSHADHKEQKEKDETVSLCLDAGRIKTGVMEAVGGRI